MGVTVQDADEGDTTTMVETLITAAEQVEAVGAAGIVEVVGDKGYHSNETMVRVCRDRGAELRVGAGSRAAHVEGQGGRARGGVCQSAADSGRARATAAAPSAASCWNGPTRISMRPAGMRRVHLRGHPNILKRVLVHVCGFNLGLLMRQLTGVGTPRSLQGRAAAVFGALIAGLSCLWTLVSRSWAPEARDRPDWSCSDPVDTVSRTPTHRFTKSPFYHGLLDADGQLNRPDLLFFADRGGMADIFSHTLGPNIIAIDHETMSAMEAAGVRRLSVAAELELIEIGDRKSGRHRHVTTAGATA